MKQCIESERLILRSRTVTEMTAVYEAETDVEMKQAYREMLDAMLRLGDEEQWACDWEITLKDGTRVGGIGFKGKPDRDGCIELGYGIDPPFRHQGIATEAAGAMTAWAFRQQNVRCVQAQTDPANAVSQKVLLANDFVRNGYGNEGPLFEKKPNLRTR